jgi:lysophospholipase L1-like esterase
VKSVALLAIMVAAMFCRPGVSHDLPIWTGTWQASPVGLPTVAKLGSAALPALITARGTIRYRIRISQGGRQIRLRFSNEYGSDPLQLGTASLGMAAEGLDVVPGSLKRVTFGSRESITIPAGAPVLSDAVDLPVTPLSDLVVSVYVPQGIQMFACTPEHSRADQMLVADSDATLINRFLNTQCMFTMTPIVSGADVRSDRSRPVVVAFGDSITEGAVNPKTGERGWPGVLARRLNNAGISVVNAGIGGNRLLQSFPMFGASALSRLDRDVLAVPGVRHIVLLAGMNDIGMSGPEGPFGNSPLVDPSELIAAYSQITARAHERGLKVVAGTMLPFQGAYYYSAEKERVRLMANAWIRTSLQFDAVIDFDAVMQDPTNPGRLKIDFDSGDHLHPNPAGYQHMGDSIDLSLFK